MCYYRFPRTNFESMRENPVKRLFYGRVDIEEAMALYNFQSKSRIQKLIHSFKYKGEQELAKRLGREIGEALQGKEHYASLDGIVPIPLHPKKMKKRGYNQAQHLALGIAEALAKPLFTQAVQRSKMTATQTKKSVFERWENVHGIFEVNASELTQSKHILLVDDVITTGSTIESCAHALLSHGETKVSVASLAWAEH